MTPVASIFERSNDQTSADHGLPDLETIPETARRILLAGLELFADRGFHGTSIRDIAAAAGVQSASLYTYFSSKEALLAELVTVAHTEHHRALMSAVVGADADPRDQLRTLISAHVAAHCRWTKLAVVANRELGNLSPAAGAAALALRASSSSLLVEIIERGLDQQVFVLADLDVTLSAIASLGMAVVNWYPAQAARYTPEQVGAIYADLTLAMVGAAQ